MRSLFIHHFCIYVRALVGHRKPTEEEIKLNELVKFFVEVKIHDHANYFVDSLWDHTDVLQVRMWVHVKCDTRSIKNPMWSLLCLAYCVYTVNSAIMKLACVSITNIFRRLSSILSPHAGLGINDPATS